MFITNSCNLQIEKCKVVYYLISVYNSDYCIRFHLKFITNVNGGYIIKKHNSILSSGRSNDLIIGSFSPDKTT